VTRDARGDLLAFADADDVVPPGWLAAHVRALADADVSAGFMDSWSLNEQGAPRPALHSPPPP
jgi:cellulose synthase/poly-beta-1,6-N-acetylglucosamine synthase-like glycosyltransferase